MQCLGVEGIKNGCPCIVEIRGTRGHALVGECKDVAKARATIRDLFFNMESKTVKIIEQNKTRI